MKTCYIVSELIGGSWEYYEIPQKVFLSKENANKYIESESIEITEESLSISVDQFQDALKEAWDEFPDDKQTSFPELIVKTGKHPEWKLEDLKMTDKFIRRSEDHWVGFSIKEIELCQ